MRETLFRIVLRMAEGLPLSVRATFFEAAMLLVWAIDGKHRRIARTNLRIAFPEMGAREASRIVRLCYIRMGTSAAEFVEIPKMDARYIEDHFRIEGMENIRRTHEVLGKGALAMTGHFGNWELLAHVFGKTAGPASFIVRPLKDPVIERFVTERREWSGNRTIRKADSAKEVIREIRRNRLVGILIDQNVDVHKGVLVDFFTRKAYTTDGIARLALAVGTNIHPAFIFRDPRHKFRHVLRFGPPIPMDPGAPRDEEVARLMRRCNEALEAVIREDPVQWFWLHRRWKTRPPGEPAVYRGAR